MKNANKLFWILTATISTALVLPKLVMDGMFMDGVLYTSVASNLAKGVGTFWFPIFSYRGMADLTTFHEQPPLGIGIQALFFKMLGNSLYVERFYSLLTCFMTAGLISLVWKQETLKEDSGIKPLGWLPILFWIITPVCFWSYQNNMLENTMGVFTLASVLLSLKAVNSKQGLWYITGSGICIFCASLTKGLPGFFPVIIFGLMWLTRREISLKKVILYTSALIAVPVSLYAGLLLYKPAYQSLKLYLTKRVLVRITSNPTVDNRFFTLWALFMELLPVILLILLMGVVFYLIFKKKPKLLSADGKAFFYLAAGAAGSLPLMLTMVQKRFYFTHALPFFAIGFAYLIAPVISKLIGKINTPGIAYRITIIIACLLLASVLVFSATRIGKTKRDGKLLGDVYAVGKMSGPGSVIKIDSSMCDEWALQCYLIRYFNISVDVSETKRAYLLLKKTAKIDIGKDYTKVGIPLNIYDLYKVNTP